MKLHGECSICGSSRIRPYAVSFGKGLHNSIACCPDCGIYFANPMRSEEELKSYYSSFYYGDSQGPTESAFHDRVSSAKKQIAREIVTLSPPPGNFLEIGSGFGVVLEAAKAMGYSPIGIEPGDSAREYARERGFTVHAEALEECNFEDSSFDVIYAWHVIEHVPDMSRFLNEVHRILKPGGLFFFGTENYRCLYNLYSRSIHLVSGSLPTLDTADEHTFLFTPRSVKRIFPRFGFRLSSVKAFQPRHKADKFFAPARRGSMPKRTVHWVVLGSVYGLSLLLPKAGAHLKASVVRDR